MAGTSRHESWVRSLSIASRAHVRFFCLPYAGGSASMFQPWAARLSSDVELFAFQLPGREDRIAELPFERMRPLVAALADSLAPYLDRPFLLFGHSMGAIVAFELVRELRRRRRPLPNGLIVSGHRAPHLHDPRAPLHQQPTEQLIEDLRKLNGTPREVMEHGELRELVIPALRADFAVCETYVFVPEVRLDVPISALAGDRDREVTQAEAAAWREHTSGTFTLDVIPGDHFFLQSARPLVVNAVTRALARVLANARAV